MIGFGFIGSARSMATRVPTVLAVQNVSPSGANPLSWPAADIEGAFCPSTPLGVLDSSRGCRQSVLTS